MQVTKAVLVGVFADANHARQAIQDLRQAGFRENQIGVVARDAAKVVHHVDVKESDESKMAEGLGIGAATGAGLGALVGLGVLAGVVPVLGPVIAGGALAAIVANAAGGAAVVGILGGLVGLGIPKEEAQHYEAEVRAGRILVTVQPEARYEEAHAILRRDGVVGLKSGTVTQHVANVR